MSVRSGNRDARTASFRTMQSPSPNGENGRDGNGRFTRGNAGGPGNPFAKRVAHLRSLLMEHVTDADVRAIVSALVARAKKGDIAAAREVLDRTIGKSTNAPEDVEISPLEEVSSPRMIKIYADLCVPKEAWPPGYLREYVAMRKGLLSHLKPDNFDELVQQVESRCNWVKVPVPKVAGGKRAVPH